MDPFEPGEYNQYVVEFTHIHCRTTNQPGSRFAFRGPLTAEFLSELLGYDPAGETVSRVLAALTAGKGVEIHTRQVPHERDTDVVGYEFLPYAGSLEPGALPDVTTIVRF